MSEYDFFTSLNSQALEMQLESEASKKAKEVDQAVRLKQSELDPNYRVFDSNIYEAVDGDTVRDTRDGRLMRVSGGEGRAADSFETGLNRDGTPNNYYENNPGRFRAHQKAYARAFGKDVDDVSVGDLYEAGQAQKQALQENISSLDGQGFRLAGKDAFGTRDVMAFDNPQAIEGILGARGANASYLSKYNWKQLQEDRLSGAAKETDFVQENRDPLRWTTDQVVGAVGTVGDFGIDLAILGSTLVPNAVGGETLTKQLLRGKEEGWGALRDALTTDQKLQMEAMREKRSHFIQDPLYRARKAQYQQGGDGEGMASVQAWLDGAADTLENLAENPTEIVDIGLESLPYMIGSGLVAKAFTKKTMANLIANGATKGAWTKAELALIEKTATRASIGFTAVTEGMGNAVSAYQKVDSLSDAELAESESYQKLIASGLSPEQARRRIATEAGWRTFIISGALAGVANKITGAGKVEANLFRRLEDIATNNGGKAVTSKLAKALQTTGSVISPAAKEGVEEVIQSGGGEAIAQSQAAGAADAPQLIKPAASAEAAATGLAAGVATGGVAGNASRIAKTTAKGAIGGAKIVGKGVNKLKSSNVDAAEAESSVIKTTDQMDSLKDSSGSKVLGGNSSKAGKALAEVDRATGGQSADNAAQALDAIISEAEGGGKILVNTANFLLRRYKARLGSDITAEQQKKIEGYEAKVDAIKGAFKGSLSTQIAQSATQLRDLKKDGKLDTAEAETARQNYIALAKAAEVYGMNASDIAHATVSENVEDDMPDQVVEEIRQFRTTEALMGELARTVEQGGGKHMQQVAGDVLIGGGKKKGLRDYVELMQEAVTNRNFSDFKREMSSMTDFIRLKEKQARVLGNFVANMEAGMDEADALGKAQKDAGVKDAKVFRYYWNKKDNGTANLYFQMKRELNLMAASRQSLLAEWNKGAAPHMKTKKELAANRYIMSLVDGWTDGGEIDFKLMEEFVEGATGANIKEAQDAAVQLAKKEAERERQVAKEKANKARLEMLERRNYKPIQYTPKVVTEGGAANPVKTAINVLAQYQRTGNGNYVLQALEFVKANFPAAFYNTFRKRLRAKVRDAGLLWPTNGDRNAWLKTQENQEEEKQPTPTSEGETTAESKESEPQAKTTQDGAVGSTEEQSTETVENKNTDARTQVGKLNLWIEEKFGSSVFDFLTVVATDPDPLKKGKRSGFYNRQTKEITIVADQIFARSKQAGVRYQDWTTWVVFHEMGHKAIKALFGEKALKGKKAYEEALKQAFDSSSMIRELADAVSMRKWGVPVAELKEVDLDNAMAREFSAMEEAVVEIVAALQSHDFNAEMALTALTANWTDLPLDFATKYAQDFSEQSVLKKTLDGILGVLQTLLAALKIITPKVTENNTEHFLMSIAAKELMLISPEHDTTRAFPTTDNLKALTEMPVEDLQRYRKTLKDGSELAETVDGILQWKGVTTEEVKKEEDEETWVDDWGNDQDAPPAIDWTQAEDAGEQIPASDTEDPWGSEIPQGNQGSWDEGDFEPGAPEKPVGATNQETDTEAQDKPASEKEPSKKPAPKPYSDESLFNIRMVLDALQAILDMDEDIPPHQVSMPTLKASRIWHNRVDQYRQANRQVTSKQVAEWMLAKYEENLEARGQVAPDMVHNETEGSKAVVSEAQKLQKDGEIPSKTATILASTVDFLSDKMLPLLWKLARHAPDHAKKNQRWTKTEVDTDMRENGGRTLRKDLRRQFNLKGIPVWAKQAFRMSKDTTQNLLNGSVEVFGSLKDYAGRRNFFRKLGLNSKEQMGMNTIIDFVNQFHEVFNEVHLGLLDTLGDNDAQARTPLRSPLPGNQGKVDANGKAILNPILEYAMQLLYDEEGNLDANFISMMAIEVGSWLTSAAANALNNDESTIKSIYGLSEESELSADSLIEGILTQAARQGTLKSQAVQQIGQRLVRQMNIKMGGRMTPLMRQNLEVSLGEMAITVATEMGLVERRAIPDSFRKVAGDPNVTFQEFEQMSLAGPKIDLVMPRPYIPIGAIEFKDTNNPDAPKRGKVVFTADNFRESAENKHLRTAFMAARTALNDLFTSQTYVREPGFEPQEAPTMRARTNSRIPAIQRKAMQVMNNQKWIPLKGAFRLLHMIPPEKMIEVGGGHTQRQLDDAIDIQRDAMESQNATIKRAYEHAVDWVSEHGFKPFHFAYKMISVGRLYIDSNTINAQADKLHRFLFGMPGWEMEISTAMNPTGKLKEATQLFKMSMAVALDIKVDGKGPDALTLDGVTAAVDALMATPEAVAAMNAILEAEKSGKQLSAEAIDAMRAAGLLAENFYSLLALQEYAHYRAAKGGKVTVNLPLEVDGKTNGIAIGALQTPFAGIVKAAQNDGQIELFFNILAATGIFSSDKQAISYAEFREDPGARDNYEGLADDATDFVEQLREQGWLTEFEESNKRMSMPLKAKIKAARAQITRAAIESGFLELTRKLAKNPLMVSSYNAGINAVKRALQRQALENYYIKLSDISTDRSDDAEADYNRLLSDLLDITIDMGRIIYAGQRRAYQSNKDGVETTKYVRDLQMNPYTADFDKSVWGNRTEMEAQLREAFPSFEELDAYRKSSPSLNPAAYRSRDEGRDIIDFRNELAGFNAVIGATFGAGIEVGIENRIGPMREIRQMLNNGVLLMNVVAQEYFNAAVEKAQKSLRRSLTPVERNNILKAMAKKGWIPSIRTADATEIDEYLEVHDPQDEVILGPTGEPVRARANFAKRIALKMWGFLPNGLLATPGAQTSSSSLLLGPGLGLNIGVRALVKLIQSSDGTVMTRILGRTGERMANMLGVHDAFVGNPLDLMTHMVEANREFMDVQSNWDLAGETRNALNRFLQLMSDDLHISPAQRARIKSVFMKEVMKHWENFNGELSTEENFINFLNEFDGLVDENTEARKELWEQMTDGSVNQFALDGANHAVGTTLNDAIEELKTLDDAAQAVANLEGLKLEAEVSTAIADIEANRENGNPLEIFITYLKGQNNEGVAFTDALDVVWGAFNSLLSQTQKDRSRDRFREVINALKATTTLKDEDGNDLPLRVQVDANNRGIGSEYKKSTHTLVLRPGDNIESVLEDVIQLGMVAATAAKLSELHADPRDRDLVINQVLQRAVKWANIRGKDAAKAKARDLVQKLAATPKAVSVQLRLITEYLRNVQGSLEETNSGLSFEFEGKQVIDALADMTHIMANGKDRVVFYSSPRGVNQSRFNGVNGKTITQQLVRSLMEQFAQTDKLSDSEQAFLENTLKLVLDGLEDIDEILLKLVDGQPDRLNEGEYVDENSTILLETTDNVLSSPVGMSKQEVLLHEILHPILKIVVQQAGNGSNDSLILRMETLYGLAVEAVDRGEITWRTFLADTPGIDPVLDEQLARERFEHIFNVKRNADGSYNMADQETRYHEFFAIAMSNKRFADALIKVKTNPDKYTFWQNNLFDSIAGLVAEAFRWLLGARRRDNKNVKEALDQLAKDVLAANRRHQRIAKKAQDSGPIQGAMDWIDRKIIERFATLNSAKLQAWAKKNSKNYEDIQKELDRKDSHLNKLFAAAKNMTASVIDERMSMEEFRNALESALIGYNKNGTMYQLLQEILPWAERNHRYIDLLRRSNVLIDMTRQKVIETMKGSMQDIFDPFVRLTDPQRSALSRVILRTDLSVLLDTLDATQIMDLLRNKARVTERINILIPAIEQKLNNPWLWARFNLQSRSLAHMMMHGVPQANVAHTEHNVHNIVAVQGYLQANERVSFDPEQEAELIALMDELTTLRAILETEQQTLDIANEVIQHEMSRSVGINGFSGTLGLAKEHKAVSLQRNFRGNPVQTWKGYVYETFDEDIDVKFVADTAFNEVALTNDGYKKVEVLASSELLPDIAVKYKTVAVYINKAKGVNTYSKSAMNLTSEQKHGFGLYDLHLTVDEWNNDAPGKSASEVISLVEEIDYYAQEAFDQAVKGQKVKTGPALVPLYNENREVVDHRYVMSEAHKVKYLNKREYIDEILPRMFGAIEDRENTPIINHELVDLLFQEHQMYQDDKDHRFMVIGSQQTGKNRRSTIALKNDLVKAQERKKLARDQNDSNAEATEKALIKQLKQRIASQEMWDLLPKETQLYAERIFGGKYMVVRDEMYNMVFGFRKLAFANNKWLGKAAPLVRMIEKVWQEVIQWERFRIAVLEPSVVIGNMISNTFVLLAHGIPPQYIWRYFNEAVLGMRAYQKNVTRRQKLEHQIAIARQYGKPTAKLEREMFRVDHLLTKSSVHDIVEEGLFTSIVEEFGGDEQSYRRKLTNKLLDKVGVVAGSQSAVKAAQEVYMVPGSQMARFALMGTQYGDFVARYIKMKWDVEVKKMPKDKAIREALDTFIYYNIPQNKYLQWMNDNGLFMFTKFFFRIQHIAFRLFQRSPSRALAAFAFQAQYEYSVLGDSVGRYLGNVPRMFNKFDPTPFDNIADGDIFEPSLLKWMGVFFGD